MRIGAANAGDDADIEMQGGNDDIEVLEVGETGAGEGSNEEGAAPPAEDEKPAERTTFVECAFLGMPPSRSNRVLKPTGTATSNLPWSSSSSATANRKRS